MKRPTDPPVGEQLRRLIEDQGSIPVHDYMAAANAHYYAHRPAIGAAGDFITAPEISQMFGEMVGLWSVDLWLRAGKSPHPHFVELGPGRGTLASDALRAMASAGLEPTVELLETSPKLRAEQAKLLPDARWHEDLSSLPSEGPLLIVANEFFDALPVRQFDSEGRELRVKWGEGRFIRDGEVDQERSPQSLDILRGLCRRLISQGGAALIIDYGHVRPGHGDTLQAVSGHCYADPWEAPGSRDLTAHVDFHALVAEALEQGVEVHGPMTQGDWLEAMGIQLRAAALARAAPQRTEEIAAARDRLIGPGQMGRLFKVMALTAPGWPTPAAIR